MPVQYTNRIGKTYYLRQGKTKTGKNRYFFSSKLQEAKGEAVDHIPTGYEIYQRPENAQVFLQKIQPQLTTDIERQLVKNRVKTLKRPKLYRVDFKNEYITIYESNMDVTSPQNIFCEILDVSSNYFMDVVTKMADRQYTAVLRFCLDDSKQRTFVAERFCFLGGIDDWIDLSGSDDLHKLVDKYIELVGTDEFFEPVFY